MVNFVDHLQIEPLVPQPRSMTLFFADTHPNVALLDIRGSAALSKGLTYGKSLAGDVLARVCLVLL